MSLPTGFTSFDVILIVFYMVGVAWFGMRAAGTQTNATDYFLGGRSLPWWAVLFSVVATETSTLTFISIPAVAYGGNLTFLQLTIGYLLGRIVVALVLLPSYVNGELRTAYHFLEQRFGPSLRKTASTTFIITRLLADGVRLFATAIPLVVIFRYAGFFSGMGDLSLYVLAILLITLVTGFYTYFGGIRAVIWMDVVQMGVYLLGAILALGILIGSLPVPLMEGVGELARQGKLRVFEFGAGLDPATFFASASVFWVSVLGGAVFSIASHGTDQLIVQRLLTTRSLRDSQKALVASGVVAMVQFSLFLCIGLLLFIFYRGADAASLGLSTLDEVFIRFVVESMPTGLPGLIVAALLAAAMSSLSSSLNALASSTTLDLVKPVAGGHWTDATELQISRLISLAWGVVLAGSAIGFAWLQLSGGQRPAIVELGLSIASYTYGGLLGLFLLGRLTRQTSPRDALVGFFSALLLLLLLVKGPIQTLLPAGFPLRDVVIAWPLYTVVGSAMVLFTAWLSAFLTSIFKRIAQ